MFLRRYGKGFVVLLTLGFVSHAAYNYFIQKKKEKRKEINEVIMFSYEIGELKKSKYSRCKLTFSVDRLLFYVNSSKYTLDICIFVWTNTDITNLVLKLQHRGVKVRIIIDADMAYTQGSSVRRLAKHGIPVRWMKSTNIMHHKFCLIDSSIDDGHTVPFVMTGSLNWTNQALCGNWEDVVVTSQRDVVRQYKDEFDKLWVLFKPIVI